MARNVTEGLVFRTERLLVRDWVAQDAPALFEIFRDPEVSRWTSTPEPMVDIAEAEQRIVRWSGVRDVERGFGIWAIAPGHTGPPLGIVLLRPLAGTTDVEIGWTLHAGATGQGFATEATAGVIEHARAHGHSRMLAIMWPDNEPSKAVASRLGMTALGEVEDPWYGTPEEPTSLMFSLDL